MPRVAYLKRSICRSGIFYTLGSCGRELCNSIFCFAMATKNHCWDQVLLFDVVQGFTQTLSLKDMSFSPREKRRIRGSFAEATESREGFREFQFFCKVLCGKHFYGTKKASRVTGCVFIGREHNNKTNKLSVIRDF